MTLALYILVTTLSLITLIYVIKFYSNQMAWAQYYRRNNNMPHHNLLLKYPFADKFKNQNTVNILDLGAGNGQESKYFLDMGCHVYAVDMNKMSIKLVNNKASADQKPRLNLIHSSFEKLDWDSLPDFDGVIALHALPFLSKQNLDYVWNKIQHKLKPGGIFIATLFGDKVTAVDSSEITMFHSLEEIQPLLENYKVLFAEELLSGTDDAVVHCFELILQK